VLANCWQSDSTLPAVVNLTARAATLALWQAIKYAVYGRIERHAHASRFSIDAVKILIAKGDSCAVWFVFTFCSGHWLDVQKNELVVLKAMVQP
jgi:hypothetical protein